MKRKLFFATVFIVASAFSLRAQILTLDQAVRIAQDSAITAYQSKNALLRSQWEYEEFLSTRRPQLAFNLDPGYQKFTNEPALHYYKLRNYNMLNTFGELRLEQEALGLGGRFYASSSALWTEYFGPGASQRVFSMVPLGVGYTNGLLGYNSHKWDKTISDYHLESEKKAYNYELVSIACEAERYYLDCLVAVSTYEISRKNSEVSSKALEIGKEKFGIASITKNELFALELQKLNADNSVFAAKVAVDEARKKLFSFLQLEDKGQTLQIPDIPEFRTILFEDAVYSAKENNPEYRDSQESILRARQKVDKARVEGSFLQTAIDLNLGLQSNSAYLSNAYSGQKAFMVGGVTLRIPILDGGLAKSRSKVAEYNLRHAESSAEEQARSLEIDVDVQLKEFNSQQDLLKTTSEAISLADESFSMARELYGNGEIDINTFILALQRKDESYKNYLQSLKSYWDSWYALRKLCVFTQDF